MSVTIFGDLLNFITNNSGKSNCFTSSFSFILTIVWTIQIHRLDWIYSLLTKVFLTSIPIMMSVAWFGFIYFSVHTKTFSWNEVFMVSDLILADTDNRGLKISFLRIFLSTSQGFFLYKRSRKKSCWFLLLTFPYCRTVSLLVPGPTCYPTPRVIIIALVPDKFFIRGRGLILEEH